MDHTRRLHANKPELMPAQLLGVKGGRLSNDPAFQGGLPPELAAIRDTTPRHEWESRTGYARRLHADKSDLTLAQLALLSGVSESNLRSDPAFWGELPSELAAIRDTTPRRERESKIGYARRLHADKPDLTLLQLAQLSGVTGDSLRSNPEFRGELPPKLAAIRDTTPRRDGESNISYARRLHAAKPDLTLAQLAQLSGVMESNLRGDPAFQGELPPELAAIRDTTPRRDGETNISYARRLHAAKPSLTLAQLSRLSRVSGGSLRCDPAFRGKLSPELVAIRDTTPRREGESRMGYARRLHIDKPDLTLAQLAQLSGVTERNLRSDPAFWGELPPELVAIRDTTPRREEELNSDYARRLRAAKPDLTLVQLAQLSGVREGSLRSDPALRGELPPELAAVRDTTPRHKGESKIDYARRLHAAKPNLTLAQLARLSGITETSLRSDPVFWGELPPELAAVRDTTPRHKGETSIGYARRLRATKPDLTLAQLAQLSGLTESSLRCDPAFWGELPPELVAIRDTTPRREGESKIEYARRLYAAKPDLTFAQFAQLSGAKESSLRGDLVFRGKRLPELAAIRDTTPRHESRLLDANRPRLMPEQPPGASNSVPDIGDPSGAAPTAAIAVQVELVQVKSESAPRPAPISVFVERTLDQSRTAYFRELAQLCDLTGERAAWSSVLEAAPGIVVRHRMDPVPALENAFPLRDPSDPLHRVHPRYADVRGHIAAGVQATEARLGRGYFRYIEALAKHDEHRRLAPMRRTEVTLLRDSLQADVLAEMQRLIAGRAQDVPRCRPRRLQANELLAHEQILAGQYGLFAVDALAPEQRPTLSNGKILALYMGALLESDDEMAQYAQTHPDSLAYDFEVSRHRVLAGLGATNSVAFANTALLPGPEPAYDHQRLNAVFIPFDVSMIDRDGGNCREAVIALVALDNLYSATNPAREVRVDYGEAYLAQFATMPCAASAFQAATVIKREE
ncbi:hypothetical protein [Pandoraea pulmonicola]|nr:hypothetical protein [Pandoraea pulmonicola]SUA93217.1 Uncharacterised protein [Pandoraea pulmonicola]